jgi:ketosteroid isomerase-like protein
MNSQKTIAVVVISAFLIVAAAAVPRDPAGNNSSTPDVQKAVLARLAEIQDAAQSLDVDKVFSFVMENDKGALAQNGRLFLTRKEALESTKQGFQGIRKVSYRLDKQHITLLSPTVALAVGEGESSATLADGRTLDTHFVQSVVFVLTDGQWKVFHSHRSFPPAQ